MIASFIVLFMIVCVVGGFYGMPFLFAFPPVILLVIIVAHFKGHDLIHHDESTEQHVETSENNK